MLILIGSVNAQQNLAQEAYAIFEDACLICHGKNGSNTEALIIEHAALIDDGKVVPGNPDGSVFYQRLIETNLAKRMPQGQPALDPEAIETDTAMDCGRRARLECYSQTRNQFHYD